MPKKIDPAVRERTVRLVLEHRAEYPSNQQAVAAVVRREGVVAESLRRWVMQAGINAGGRDGQTAKNALSSSVLGPRTGGCAKTSRS